MTTSYWNNTGKYEALYAKLYDLIPREGEVPNKRKNRHLEKMRKAANCYYDLFNNGLCNRAAEFRQVFGFGGTSVADSHFNPTDPKLIRLEQLMSEIILAAAHEQNIPIRQ